MTLGTTVRTIADFISITPRHAIRPSAPASDSTPERQIKIQTVFADIFNTVRPFPEAFNALRGYFRRTPEWEIVE